MHSASSPRFPRFVPFVFLTIAAASAFVPAGAPARAEEEPPLLEHDVGAFALYGRTYVKWHGAASMPQHAGVGSDASVELSDETVADGENSYVAAPSVLVEDASRLHFVFADAFQASADVAVEHPVADLDAPVVADIDFPAAPAVTCGGADLTVDASNSPFSLAPGRYGNVTVSQDQVLRLEAAGRYELCSLRVKGGATVEAHGGTMVLLRDFLVTAAKARITGSGACGARWIAAASAPTATPSGAAFEFDQGGPAGRALIEGDFFTPGRIMMAQHNDYVGRFWADRVDGRVADSITRTVTDCRSARCGDGHLDPGEACDDGNNREGDCCSAFCEVLKAGSACDDGAFCTTGDVCDAAGLCVGGGNPCAVPDGDGDCAESCNEETDACNGADPDGSLCDDGSWCNGADLCASGGCVSHAGSPCGGPDDDADCRESCDEATRSCDAPDPVGAPCSDGRFCTSGENCDAAGACSGGRSPCPGADADADCTEGCDELADACTAFDDDGTGCDDGVFCTATDTCDGRGHCRGWGDPCAAALGDGDEDCSESCDEAAASCSAPDLDGTACSDGLACTTGERCIAGACVPGAATGCDDANPCTDEFCGVDGSCVREYNSAPCDDGNPCTTGDRCILGACGSTGEVDCRDDDLCSTDTCDPADGSCHHSWTPADTCHVLGRSLTRIDLGFSPKEGEPVERLTTSWRSEEEDNTFWREELGDPSAGDAFSVCFFDESESVAELAYRFDFDATTLDGATWTRRWRSSDLVYRLKAPDGTSQGVSAVRLGGGKHGSPSFRLRAGAGGGCSSECQAKFSPPEAHDDGRIFLMEPGMTVQWVAATGACWSARYERAEMNEEQGFHARARPR